VPIAGAGSFLLPHTSTSEQCLRDGTCYRNVLRFKDCKKFGAETHIVYEDSKPK